MEDDYLYQQISKTIRRQIMNGELKPGDRLPSVRRMTGQWGCTIGTVQHAYQELARQGLVTTRPGQGTRVIASITAQEEAPLRRATLVHRAEAFLLEVLTAGYSPSDVEDAIRQALERWRTVAKKPAGGTPAQTLTFTGSHDLAVAWIATHFNEIVPGFTLHLNFTGSLGGLIALAENNTLLAGCHLWDAEAGEYNRTFIQRLLPGKRVALVTLAYRNIGLVTSPRNPYNLHNLHDLTQTGLRFVNRQSGSGTRVWLDANLNQAHIDTASITGYNNQKQTHSEVARAVAEGTADAGLCLQAAAQTYGLGFIPMTQERYDLVLLEDNLHQSALGKLLAWLESTSGIETIGAFGGYDVRETGKIRWV
jgi:molybdate-binding protein/DNA-binding transcriptional regulator YhcF (GntR family)